MAQAFCFKTKTGLTLYQRRLRLDGTTLVIQNPTTGVWSASTEWVDSAKTITESVVSPGTYVVDLSDLPPMTFDLDICEKLGDDPAATDTALKSGSIRVPLLSPLIMESAR